MWLPEGLWFDVPRVFCLIFGESDSNEEGGLVAWQLLESSNSSCSNSGAAVPPVGPWLDWLGRHTGTDVIQEETLEGRRSFGITVRRWDRVHSWTADTCLN